MTEVRTLFTDPKTVAIEGEYGTWLVSGIATNRIRDLVVDADGLLAVSDELAAQVEDAIVVFVSATDQGGRLAAFRSVTSSRDVFYLKASDGTLVLTDHYRNAVSQLDPADRTVDRNAVVDHLLFGSPIEPSTYVVEIGRLGRGECLHWNGVDREWTRTLVDRLDTVERYDPREAVDQLDDALANVVRVGVRPDARTLLSSGADSTLLASYRRDSPRPVQVTIDSPEFQSEVDAGREAADLLDASRDVVALSETAFLDYLESTVDALGLPPRYEQTVLVAAGLQSLDPGQYVDGQGADALFGLPGVKAARIADWTAPLLESNVVSRAANAAPSGVTAIYDALAARRRQLARSVANPESFAQTLASDVDPDAVAAIFDPQVVRDRTGRRVEYTAERAPLDAGSTFARQAATGHLVEFLAHDAANRRRQLGFGQGQDIVAPFRMRRVARTALAVPPDRRYVQGLRAASALSTKYIPKTLLSRRLPEFHVPREKGDSSLPVDRYVNDGPLQSAIERYGPPAFLTPESYERHVQSYGSLTWELLTYSVWRERILRDPDLGLVPGTERRYLRLPLEPATPPT